MVTGPASKIGIREFRADLACFVDADAPVAVTRHGRTLGYSIPVKQDRVADAAALAGRCGETRCPACAH